MTTQQPEALRLAEKLHEGICSLTVVMQPAAAMLRVQHDRIAELEASLVKEAARTASEKRRADQMSQQHDMQAALNRDAREQLAALAATQPAAQPVAWLAEYVDREGNSKWYVSTHKDLATENDMNAEPKPLYTHPTQQGLDARKWLQQHDFEALERFAETSEDDESYDIGKEAIQRLTHFGCLNSHGFGRYSITAFGSYVLDNWSLARELPFKMQSERDAEHRAALAAQAKQGGA